MKFGLFERRIRLEGEAYFEVTHNPRRPFVVEFEGGEIQVLGTSFNVKAYRDDDIVAVTLDEGRVVLDDRRGGRFELSPSEQLLYDRRSGEGRIVRGADAMRYSIWKDDVISFRDTPLAEVLETLSRWYDVRFETDGQPDRPISYTFATDNTLLDSVLCEMELISPGAFRTHQNRNKGKFQIKKRVSAHRFFPFACLFCEKRANGLFSKQLPKLICMKRIRLLFLMLLCVAGTAPDGPGAESDVEFPECQARTGVRADYRADGLHVLLCASDGQSRQGRQHRRRGCRRACRR